MKSRVKILTNVNVFESIDSENLERLKPFLYGLIFPMAILLFTHSLIAMVSIQTLLFFVQNNIQKNQKKARETIKFFVFFNVMFGIMFIPFLFSV